MLPSRFARSGWVCLLVAMTIGVIGAAPRTAVAQSDRSLLKSDLVRMMTGNSYTAEEVLQIVRMNCVGFAPSDRDRKDLARLFDGDDLLDEIDRCRETSHSDGYRRGVPVAKEVEAVKTPNPSPTGPEFTTLAPTGGTFDRPSLETPPLGTKSPAAALPGVVPGTPPRLLNWEHVSRRILSDYRPDERHQGSIVLRIWVDDEGRASDATIVESDGDPSLASVALASVKLMEFAPAKSRDRSVGAWATLPIHFKTD